MIDSDDIGNAALFGSIPVLVILVILYFVFSRPEIDACHEKSGVIVRVEGKDVCVDKAVLKPAAKEQK